MVYIPYATPGFMAQILPNVSLQVQKALEGLYYHTFHMPSVSIHCPE